MFQYQYYMLVLTVSSAVLAYPQYYDVQNFKIGIEYEHSLPMSGGSDRYRHRNNYDPFYVTVTASAKHGFVISYIEVKATVDMGGTVEFTLIRGQTGARSMTFQLVSNHSDFLSYSYLSYGVREEEYKKLANIITLPITNYGSIIRLDLLTVILSIALYYTTILLL